MPKATGTDRSDIVGAKLGVDYHKVNLANGVVIEKLDDWFCGLAKWCLSPDCLFGNPEQYEICMASRRKLCEGLCATRSLSVDTLKTYCNGIARAVKQSGGPSVVVTSSKVLPRFYTSLSVVKMGSKGSFLLKKTSAPLEWVTFFAIREIHNHILL